MRDLASRAVSPSGFVRLSATSLAALYLVVTSGAFVRLTASGLGCDNWPRCGDKPYPETGYHAFVEFGNRVVALIGIVLTLGVFLAARRTAGLSTIGRRAALGAFVGAVAQIPLGGVTVILDLHPVAVMSHFLLALIVVGLAAVVVLEAVAARVGRGTPIGPLWWRTVLAGLVGVSAVLVVTGAVVTASGPHSGGEDIRRLGVAVNDAVYVHVRASAVFGLGFLLAGVWLVRNRRLAPGIVTLAGLLLSVLIVQMILGEVQYRNAIPWGLVLAHVFLAASLWTLMVVLAHAAWRPPRTLAA